jgi:hypothetical protein
MSSSAHASRLGQNYGAFTVIARLGERDSWIARERQGRLMALKFFSATPAAANKASDIQTEGALGATAWASYDGTPVAISPLIDGVPADRLLARAARGDLRQVVPFLLFSVGETIHRAPELADGLDFRHVVVSPLPRTFLVEAGYSECPIRVGTPFERFRRFCVAMLGRYVSKDGETMAVHYAKSWNELLAVLAAISGDNAADVVRRCVLRARTLPPPPAPGETDEFDLQTEVLRGDDLQVLRRIASDSSEVVPVGAGARGPVAGPAVPPDGDWTSPAPYEVNDAISRVSFRPAGVRLLPRLAAFAVLLVLVSAVAAAWGFVTSPQGDAQRSLGNH